MPYKDPEKRKACKRRWNRNNPEYFKKWHQEHPEFAKNSIKRVGILRRYSSAAKKRIANNRLKSIYGISWADYEQKLIEQNHVCAVCGNPEKRTTNEGGLRKLSVDHRHDETRQVRGLLCGCCNTVLGLFDENVARFQSAINYLNKWNGEENGI